VVQFVNDSSRGPAGTRTGSVSTISKIFKWFKGDFEKATAYTSETPGNPLLAFLEPFIRNESPVAALSGNRDISIPYPPYDWRLNDGALIHSPTSKDTADDG